jgi:putative ABC transport system permease protein
MIALRSIYAVTVIGLESLPSRIGTSLVTVIGMAGVVGVLVSIFAMSNAFNQSMRNTAKVDGAIVMRSGANNEVASALSIAEVQTIMDAPGIARTANGEVAASPELFMAVNLQRKEDDSRAGVVIRGVSPAGFALRPEIEVVEGRMFESGLKQLIVGRSAQLEFDGLEIGDEVMLRGGPWTVVGVFVAPGTATEATLFADGDTLLSAYQRTVYNGVKVKLESVGAYDIFRDTLMSDPSLSVNVMREEEYYGEVTEGIEVLFVVITYVVGGIMAVGAFFAALNTMYSAVSARTLEIATLRAIGYGAGGVAFSVLAEAFLLALLGAVIGAAAAALLFNGNTISLGGAGGSIAAQMEMSTRVLAAGAAWACAVGFLGGVFPAVRATRVPVATALRAV